MINVTREALDRFRAMVDEQNDKAVVLRLYARNVEGELRYGMSWGEREEEDVVIEGDGVSLYVEELSIPYWNGASIDYYAEDLRQGFTIRAPGASAGGCACGGNCSCGGHH